MNPGTQKARLYYTGLELDYQMGKFSSVNFNWHSCLIYTAYSFKNTVMKKEKIYIPFYWLKLNTLVIRPCSPFSVYQYFITKFFMLVFYNIWKKNIFLVWLYKKCKTILKIRIFFEQSVIPKTDGIGGLTLSHSSQNYHLHASQSTTEYLLFPPIFWDNYLIYFCLAFTGWLELN